jgi:hypothetical protein
LESSSNPLQYSSSKLRPSNAEILSVTLSDGRVVNEEDLDAMPTDVYRNYVLKSPSDAKKINDLLTRRG